MIRGKKVNEFIPTKCFVFVIIVSIFSAVFFEHHYDAYALTTWWTTFIDCIREGNIAEFQHRVMDLGMPCNYSLFSNIFFSIWMIPVYIVVKLLHLETHLRIYTIWLKLLIIISNFCIARIMQLFLSEQKVDENRQILVVMAYLLSPFVQIYSIAMGQIDAVGLLLCLIGIRCMYKNKYGWFVVLSTISFLLKPFVVFIIMPFLVNLWWENKGKAFLSGALMLGLYCVQNLVQNIIVTDYKAGGAYWNECVLYPRLFKYTLYGIPMFFVFSVLIGLACLYIGKKRKLELLDHCFFQLLILIVFEALVEQHPQWFIYFAVPAFMLGLGLIKDKLLSWILYFIEWIFCLNVLTGMDYGDIVAKFGTKGLLSKFCDYSGLVTGDVITSYFPAAGNVAKILLTVSSFLLLVVAIYHKDKVDKEYESKKEKVWPLFLPTLFLQLVIIIGYIGPM